jgi:hypothetical protein
VSILAYFHQKKRLESCPIPSAKICSTPSTSNCLIPTQTNAVIEAISADGSTTVQLYGISQISPDNGNPIAGVYLFVSAPNTGTNGLSLPPNTELNNTTWNLQCLNSTNSTSQIAISTIDLNNANTVIYVQSTTGANSTLVGQLSFGANQDITYSNPFNVIQDQSTGYYTLEFFGNMLWINTTPVNTTTGYKPTNNDIQFAPSSPGPTFTSLIQFVGSS